MPVCGIQFTHSSQLHPSAVIWSQGCKAHGPQSMEMNLYVITSSKRRHWARHSEDGGCRSAMQDEKTPICSLHQLTVTGLYSFTLVLYSPLWNQDGFSVCCSYVVYLNFLIHSLVKIALLSWIPRAKGPWPFSSSAATRRCASCTMDVADLWHLSEHCLGKGCS